MPGYQTLADLAASPYYLWAACSLDHSCGHCGRLDLGALIARFGPGFDSIAGQARIVSALRCSKCGRKGAEIRLGVRNAPTPEGGHNRSFTGIGGT